MAAAKASTLLEVGDVERQRPGAESVGHRPQAVDGARAELPGS